MAHESEEMEMGQEQEGGMMGRHKGRMGHGMMGRRGRGMGGRCPMCGQKVESGEGPHRGKGPAQRSDEEIRAEVEEALTEDSWLDASEVQVSVEGGVVTLTGTVDARASKRRAEDLTDQVSGVRDVDNNLSIAGL